MSEQQNQNNAASGRSDSKALLERGRFEAWLAKRGTPPALEHPQAWDAWQAAKTDNEDEDADAIKADVYDTLAELLEPHMMREGGVVGFLPTSVSEAVQMLLEQALKERSNTALTGARPLKENKDE